jgi:hypothetical protein
MQLNLPGRRQTDRPDGEPRGREPPYRAPRGCERPDREPRPAWRRSLSIRLLLLTMGLVLVAEILVLIPNIARDRQVILREKTLEA